jgi:hypothetical protein
VFFEVGKGLGKQTDTISEDNLDAMQKVQLQISHFANAFSPKTQTLRSSMEEALTGNKQGVFATDILYIIVSFCSKASLAFLYLRLTQIRAHFLAVWGILGTCAGWAVMSVMVLSIGCHVGDPWATWDTQCANFVSTSIPESPGSLSLSLWPPSGENASNFGP